MFVLKELAALDDGPDKDDASRKVIEVLAGFKQQLVLFKSFSERLKASDYRQALVKMFAPMINFWVTTTVRISSRMSRDKYRLSPPLPSSPA
jgi:hypothetical protein